MKITNQFILNLLIFLGIAVSCSDNLIESDTTPSGYSDDNPIHVETDCTKGIILDHSRGACSEILDAENSITFSQTSTTLRISSNNIPEHRVGLFGNVEGALNPNLIRSQSSLYEITISPQLANMKTQLSGLNGPEFAFGVLLNGVELDPVAAEPWPHIRGSFTNVNWEWNLEASNVQIGLDCNNAHVQPTGKYHYHGIPTLLLEKMNVDNNQMTHIGYAADGFPIYYKYAYSDSNDNSSNIIEMQSGYLLKEGERPGDGETAPCGVYNGIYSNDYEYVSGIGNLDECNGRQGITPEFPNGTYYYMITENFPGIPRCFSGTPSNDFRLGA